MLTWTGDKVVEQMRSLRGVKSITIATAFMSQYGLNLLKEIISANDIMPANVKLFLSMRFSDINPVEILKELSGISKAYIVDKRTLHAKVFLFKGPPDFLVTGSSNFTEGGFLKNLELNTVTDSPETARLTTFFERCEECSTLVDDSVIAVYKNAEAERKMMRQAQASLQNKMKMQLSKDTFSETYYPNINNQFFVYRDYETLFTKNESRSDPDIISRRESIREKLLILDSLVQEKLGKLELAHHWRPENVTSGIIPNEQFNQNKVNWCGVRYSRKKTVDYVRELKLSGDGHGFPKYACMQFCLTPWGFEVNLFHAVRKDAVDRDFFRDQRVYKAYREDVTRELGLLRGNTYRWCIGDEDFALDDRDPEDFMAWHKEKDDIYPETESCLVFHTNPDDPSLKTASTISSVIMTHVNKMLPLFKLMSKRWGE